MLRRIAPEGDWCVYQHATGTYYKVTPPTEANALREILLLGEPGHEAMPLLQATRLANAFTHGRFYAIERIRELSAGRG